MRKTKPVLFVGDSHLARIDAAYTENKMQRRGEAKAVFLPTPGLIGSLVSFQENGELTLNEDLGFLKNQPAAKQQNLKTWYERSEKRFQRLVAGPGVTPDKYSALVILGFQSFGPEVWAGATLAHLSGALSRQAWATVMDETHRLNRFGAVSHHARLLDQANKSGWKNIYSVATPARFMPSPFPDELVKAEASMCKAAVRKAEDGYADIVLRNYESVLLRYPDALLADDGFSTRLEFQNAENDFNHLNKAGSRIFLQELLTLISGQN